LHTELALLIALFYSDEISEEEWALLQIHMAYCDECHQTFLARGGCESDNQQSIKPRGEKYSRPSVIHVQFRLLRRALRLLRRLRSL
jgi:hypothetical protein